MMIIMLFLCPKLLFNFLNFTGMKAVYVNRSDYDFSGKRVRYCGNVMTKFDICYHIDSINPFYTAVHCLYDVCKYDELSDMLKSLLN